MCDSAREMGARSKIWLKAGSSSMAHVWEEYASEMARLRGIPLDEALEHVSLTITNWSWEKICIVCGQDAEWMMATRRLAIYYGYCDTHAREQSNFEDTPDGFPWMRPF